MIILLFFFFNDTATTEIYTLSLHDALPISAAGQRSKAMALLRRVKEIEAEDKYVEAGRYGGLYHLYLDRKSTRLNSSHSQISYAVFCLKKKKKQQYLKLHHDVLLSKTNSHR